MSKKIKQDYTQKAANEIFDDCIDIGEVTTFVFNYIFPDFYPAFKNNPKLITKDALDVGIYASNYSDMVYVAKKALRKWYRDNRVRGSEGVFSGRIISVEYFLDYMINNTVLIRMCRHFNTLSRVYFLYIDKVMFRKMMKAIRKKKNIKHY